MSMYFIWKYKIIVLFVYFCDSALAESIDSVINLQNSLKLIGDQTLCPQYCQTCSRLNKNITSVSKSRPFFFIHIPKTGGVSIELDTRKVACPSIPNFRKTDCFCARNKFQFSKLYQSKWKYNDDPQLYSWHNYTVFCGHMEWGLFPGFVETMKPIQATVLRDPIDRALSHWNMDAGNSLHFNNAQNHTFHEMLKISISKFGQQKTLHHTFGSGIRNEQVIWICGIYCHPSMNLLKGLQTAKSNLLKTAIVAIQEDLTSLLIQYQSILPWWPKDNNSVTQFSKRNIKSSRRKAKQITRSQLSDEEIWLLKEFLWADFELYELAKRLSFLKKSWVSSCSILAEAKNCEGFIDECY